MKEPCFKWKNNSGDESMKILIVYHTMTGNTEKIAKSLQEGLAGEEVTLIKAEEADPLALKSYDLVLVGSGIYAGTFHKSVKKLLKDASQLPAQFALFYTHADMDPITYQTYPSKVRKIIDKAGSSIVAEFECLGENKGVSPEQIEAQLQALPPDQREAVDIQRKLLIGHPNAEDLEKAKNFAKSLI